MAAGIRGNSLGGNPVDPAPFGTRESKGSTNESAIRPKGSDGSVDGSRARLLGELGCFAAGEKRRDVAAVSGK